MVIELSSSHMVFSREILESKKERRQVSRKRERVHSGVRDKKVELRIQNSELRKDGLGRLFLF
jgi:hypothetical protein